MSLASGRWSPTIIIRSSPTRYCRRPWSRDLHRNQRSWTATRDQCCWHIRWSCQFKPARQRFLAPFTSVSAFASLSHARTWAIRSSSNWRLGIRRQSRNERGVSQSAPRDREAPSRIGSITRRQVVAQQAEARRQFIEKERARLIELRQIVEILRQQKQHHQPPLEQPYMEPNSNHQLPPQIPHH
jgi:hypothetical protein